MRSLVGAAIALLIVGMVTLRLWEKPPVWLTGARQLAVSVLRWAGDHLLTMAVAGLLVSVAGVLAPFLLERARREAAVERHRVQDRAVMLQRVRYKWIEGVLKPSLANAARLALGLQRHPTAVPLGVRVIRHPAREVERLPPNMTVHDVFDQAGGGLLILGAPGSGKTTALLELAEDLLDSADQDDTQPIPVVFNLSSWVNRRSALTTWLIDELADSYQVPRSTGQAWILGGHVLPLLDGLDEVAEAYRARCVAAINSFRVEYGLVRLAVCSRTEEYEGLASKLRLEEAIELQPPTQEQVDAYLGYLEQTGTPLADVRTALERDQTLQELLHSPLVLHVVALAYRGRSANDLHETGSLGERQRRLFQAYVERMLEQRPAQESQGARTLRWLAQLAVALRDREQTEFHLDRLQPDWLPTSTQQRLVVVVPSVAIGVVCGLIFGAITSLGFGAAVGFTAGVLFGLAVVVGFTIYTRIGLGSSDEQVMDLTMQGGHWPWSKRIDRSTTFGVAFGINFALYTGLIFGLVAGLTAGVIFGLAAGLAMALAIALSHGMSAEKAAIQPIEEARWSWSSRTAWLTLLGLAFGVFGGLVLRGLATGVIFGMFATIIVAYFFGLGGKLAEKRSRPNEGIHRSARYALIFGVLFGLTCGPACGLYVGISRGASSGRAAGVAFGLIGALEGGAMFGGLAYLRHSILRALLVYNHAAPMNYVAFLNNATDRLLMRRIGGAYLFIHRSLRDYFADSGLNYRYGGTQQLSLKPDESPK